MNKVINTDAEYEAALAKIEDLIDFDPDAETPEAEQLNLLTLLVQDYESRMFQISMPDPIEAIKFRMEQQNLIQRDLVPFIGSRSKVSEVLSGKRQLTLSMIRSLHAGLGIPAKILLQEQTPSEINEKIIDWGRFPLKEMVDRGWLTSSASDLADKANEILVNFFAPIGIPKIKSVLYRQTSHVRSERLMDEYALAAWTVRIMRRAIDENITTDYQSGSVNIDFMREVIQFSLDENGPILACEFLKNHGIALVIEPHLPRTHLDGAAILFQLKQPIIGVTLRYDRIDNFWFTLMHELAHVSLHFHDEPTQFFDDLDLEYQDDPREKEADELAGEALIPSDIWNRSPARHVPSPEAAKLLANKLQIHPAIVAGRVRYEQNDYRLLNNLVGHKLVRRLFSEIKWG